MGRRPHLDCGLVMGEGEERSHTHAQVGVPHNQVVVIATAGQAPAIPGPLQAADFLCVGSQGAHMVLSHTNIMVVDGTCPRATVDNRKNCSFTVKKKMP